MVGTGGAIIGTAVGAGAYKVMKSVGLNRRKKSVVDKSNNANNNANSHANGNRFQEPHDNAPFDELSNYTEKWQGNKLSIAHRCLLCFINTCFYLHR
jgi:hypothetical protein